MLVSLFQLFEVVYPDGMLFFDRSGALSRRLQELLPGLLLRKAIFEQRDFVLPNEDLELIFGPTLARIQTMAPGQEDFPGTAAQFLGVVTEGLEIAQLNEFHFRHVLGQPCASDEEAQKLMAPLIDQETKEKLHALAEPARWRALQGEFLIGNLACQSRIAIVEVVPHPKLAGNVAQPGTPVPHLTVQVDFRGTVPITVAEFDAKSFMQNVRDKQTREILDKLAPHLT